MLLMQVSICKYSCKLPVWEYSEIDVKWQPLWEIREIYFYSSQIYYVFIHLFPHSMHEYLQQSSFAFIF